MSAAWSALICPLRMDFLSARRKRCCHSERSEESNWIYAAPLRHERPDGFFAALRMRIKTAFFDALSARSRRHAQQSCQPRERFIPETDRTFDLSITFDRIRDRRSLAPGAP